MNTAMEDLEFQPALLHEAIKSQKEVGRRGFLSLVKKDRDIVILLREGIAPGTIKKQHSVGNVRIDRLKAYV